MQLQKRMGGGGKERMKGRNNKKLQKKGLRDTGHAWENGRTESSREDFFFFFFLLNLSSSNSLSQPEEKTQGPWVAI